MVEVLGALTLLGLVSFAFRNGPFHVSPEWSDGRCVRCGRESPHRHAVRSVRQWRTLGRDELSVGEWFPWGGLLFPQAIAALSGWIGTLAEIPSRGITSLAIVSSMSFVLSAALILLYVSRPVTGRSASRMTQPLPESPTPPHQVRFTVVRFREGYNMADVDEFIRRTHRALESRDRSVTASDVSSVRFRPVRLKEGYDTGEVDEELDRIAAAFRGLERPPALDG
jgi:DivIVA domain-containing protein